MSSDSLLGDLMEEANKYIWDVFAVRHEARAVIECMNVLVRIGTAAPTSKADADALLREAQGYLDRLRRIIGAKGDSHRA